MFDDVERDVSLIAIPDWGAVMPVTTLGWAVVDPEGGEVEPIRRFLMDFVARGNRIRSVRSYSYDLLRWWRWLIAVDVLWNQATPAEVRDLVLWLQQAKKPIAARRTESAASAGQINAITRKQCLGDNYSPAMIQHSNAVLRSFYDYWIERGDGPLINPVQLDRRSKRPHSHHNPLEPFRGEGKIRYNPKIPKRKPRAIPDDRWVEFFGALRTNRELITNYRSFLERRRSMRPSDEYREPTEDEWREFQEHFETRKLALGECGRPYGTDCKHEHACIRCPSLRVDPRERRRLVAIIDNLKQRIHEAKSNGWTGEVNGLTVTHAAAVNKLIALNRSQNRLPTGAVDLGVTPIVR